MDELLKAVEAEDSRMIDKLIEDQGRIILNKPLAGSQQPVLHTAVRKGTLKKLALDLLITKGANMEVVDDYGLTPLHWAAVERQQEPIAELLIKHGADVHATVKPPVSDMGGGTMSSENEECRQCVKAKFAGATSLHIAARKGHDFVVMVLLEHGAESDILKKDCRGDTALHAAALAKYNSSRILQAVLEALKKKFKHDEWQFKDVQGEKRRSPLHYAAGMGDSETCKILLDVGECPLARDACGATPLHYAAAHSRHSYVWEKCALEILLDGKDISQINITDDCGQTAVHWAVEAGNTMALSVLAKYGADFHAVDDKKRTPLYIALSQKKNSALGAKKLMELMPQCQRFLSDEDLWRCMEAYFSVDSAAGQWLESYYNPHFSSPLQAPEILKELSPISLALRISRIDQIAELIKQYSKGGLQLSATINKRGEKTGRTALHWAAILGEWDVVMKLCMDSEFSRELIANAEDIYGKTALQYAKEMQHGAIEKKLLEREDVKLYVEVLYRDREVYVDAASAILVGATLIASFTSGAWLQNLRQPLPSLPCFLDQIDQSYGLVQQNAGLRLFWAFNILSFSFAIATIIAGLVGICIPSRKLFIGTTVLHLRKTLFIAVSLLALSTVFVLGAFAAGFAVMPSIFNYQANMMSTVIVGGTPCILLLAWLGRRRLWPARDRNHFNRQFLSPPIAPPACDEHVKNQPLADIVDKINE